MVNVLFVHKTSIGIVVVLSNVAVIPLSYGHCGCLKQIRIFYFTAISRKCSFMRLYKTHLNPYGAIHFFPSFSLASVLFLFWVNSTWHKLYDTSNLNTLLAEAHFKGKNLIKILLCFFVVLLVFHSRMRTITASQTVAISATVLIH